jgi:GNAT superfamily N-acetyltransferase
VRATRETRERVLAFIENEFGRIWRFEAARAFENDPATMFYVEVDGEIAGFAAHDANNRGLGFFGPTGVARAHRGRGLGGRLLKASLADLGRLGYERAIIAWTDAIDFYRKACGATVADRFITLGRRD